LRKFSDINKGRTFPYTYDRPHSGNIFISMKFPDSQSLSASWFFSSGFLYTVPKNLYQLNGNVIVNVSERNNYRMPFFHHLDIAYNFLRSWKYGTGGFVVYHTYSNPILFLGFIMFMVKSILFWYATDTRILMISTLIPTSK